MENLSRISVVLPSLDPDEKLTAVIDGLLEVGFTDIILVNDGSKPENLHYFEDAAAAHPEITLLHHPVNRGKGAALKTAFSYFLANRPEGLGVVTVDGDNQHHPLDTKACAEHLLETGNLTLGVRDFSQEDVPLRSRTGNRITSFVFKIFVGMTISDTQTGLRAISRKDLDTLVTISGDRFEYETNMLLAMKEYGIAFDEVKIRTVYIEENKSSHFRAVRDSWRIYKLILAHFFKYILSSLASSVVDIVLYALLQLLLLHTLSGTVLTLVSTVGARLASSLLNFYMNKKLVFHSQSRTGGELARYAILAVGILIAQGFLTEGAYRLFSIHAEQLFLRTVVYAAVMALLFMASYMIQQRWVFARKDDNND